MVRTCRQILKKNIRFNGILMGLSIIQKQHYYLFLINFNELQLFNRYVFNEFSHKVSEENRSNHNLTNKVLALCFKYT